MILENVDLFIRAAQFVHSLSIVQPGRRAADDPVVFLI